eukprot:GHVL01006986.1.p1 GENE.GHVL01006986.1~~GHVL01006986.1.p1  ORF type:complete len:1300 (+),score=258.71 GHVL01006986.1:1173-5072(+)
MKKMVESLISIAFACSSTKRLKNIDEIGSGDWRQWMNIFIDGKFVEDPADKIGPEGKLSSFTQPETCEELDEYGYFEYLELKGEWETFLKTDPGPVDEVDDQVENTNDENTENVSKEVNDEKEEEKLATDKTEEDPIILSLLESICEVNSSFLLEDFNEYIKSPVGEPVNTILGETASTLIDQYYGDKLKNVDEGKIFLKGLNLIVSGQPMTGKKTLAKKLAQKYSLTIVDINELIETYLKNDDAVNSSVKPEQSEEVCRWTEIGLEIKNHLLSGDQIPDDLYVEAVIHRLKNLQYVPPPIETLAKGKTEPQKIDCSGGFVLVGFPTTLVQHYLLEKRLSGGFVLPPMRCLTVVEQIKQRAERIAPMNYKTKCEEVCSVIDAEFVIDSPPGELIDRMFAGKSPSSTSKMGMINSCHLYGIQQKLLNAFFFPYVKAKDGSYRLKILTGAPSDVVEQSEKLIDDMQMASNEGISDVKTVTGNSKQGSNSSSNLESNEAEPLESEVGGSNVCELNKNEEAIDVSGLVFMLDADSKKMLIEQWMQMVNQYENRLKRFTYWCNRSENNLSYSLVKLQEDFITLIQEEDNKQKLIDDFVIVYNSDCEDFPDMMLEDATKCENHQRTEDLLDAIWQITDNKRIEWVEELDSWIKSAWCSNQIKAVALQIQEVINIEIERFWECVSFMRDTYDIASTGLLTDDVDGLKDLFIVESATVAIREPIKNNETDNEDLGVIIDRWTFPFLEELIDSARSSVSCAITKVLLPPLEAPSQKSPQPNKKGGEVKKPPPPDPIPAPSKEVMSHICKGCMIEARRVLFRIDIIHRWGKDRLQFCNEVISKTFHQMDSWIVLRVLRENKATLQIGDFIKQCIEDENMIVNPIGIDGPDFFIDSEIRTICPAKRSKPFRENADSGCFSIQSLQKLLSNIMFITSVHPRVSVAPTLALSDLFCHLCSETRRLGGQVSSPSLPVPAKWSSFYKSHIDAILTLFSIDGFVDVISLFLFLLELPSSRSASFVWPNDDQLRAIARCACSYSEDFDIYVNKAKFMSLPMPFLWCEQEKNNATDLNEEEICLTEHKEQLNTFDDKKIKCEIVTNKDLVDKPIDENDPVMMIERAKKNINKNIYSDDEFYNDKMNRITKEFLFDLFSTATDPDDSVESMRELDEFKQKSQNDRINKVHLRKFIGYLARDLESPVASLNLLAQCYASNGSVVSIQNLYSILYGVGVQPVVDGELPSFDNFKGILPDECIVNGDCIDVDVWLSDYSDIAVQLLTSSSRVQWCLCRLNPNIAYVNEAGGFNVLCGNPHV